MSGLEGKSMVWQAWRLKVIEKIAEKTRGTIDISL